MCVCVCTSVSIIILEINTEIYIYYARSIFNSSGVYIYILYSIYI